MTSCITPLHGERISISSFIIRTNHHHHRDGLTELPPHLGNSRGPSQHSGAFSNEGDNIVQMPENLWGMATSSHEVTPPLSMMAPPSSSSDLAIILSQHCSSFFPNQELSNNQTKKTTSVNPQLQLLGIITEVLDLLNDEGDQLLLDNASLCL
jgi:hypothetical protein